MRSGEFYSKGKFLLSGEYFVLYGAEALAVPLKLGQSMHVSEISHAGTLEWETSVRDKIWFTASFRLRDMEILEHSDQKTALFIQKLLKEGGRLQADLHPAINGISVRNNIEFDLRWGLGSSSSLVSNLAYWLDVDAYELYRNTFEGSGYDVFCARAEGPLIYKIEKTRYKIEEVNFRPAFKDHLFFVYLGWKQDSQDSVRKFRNQIFKDEMVIRKVSELTRAFVNASDLEEFLTLMRLHEETVSSAIGMSMVQQEIFPDFNGEIKSLGAWGGDFVMAGTKMDFGYVKRYFSGKNMPVIFRWDEIVL